MEYDEQKELARKLFPFIEIKEKDCFDQIIKKLKPHRARVLKIIEGIEIPSEWAYEWAMHLDKNIRNRAAESQGTLGWEKLDDLELMRDRVTESKWAFFWAVNLGDRDLMRPRVTEPKWAYWWILDIGDKEIMSKVMDMGY